MILITNIIRDGALEVAHALGLLRAPLLPEHLAEVIHLLLIFMLPAEPKTQHTNVY